MSAASHSGPSRAQSLLAVHKSSTLLPPSPPLRRLLMSLDKSHLIQVVLYWIDKAVTAPAADIVPPQLSRRPARRRAPHMADIDDIPGQDDEGMKGENSKATLEDATTTASFLDLYEDRRARSFDELRLLWAQVMPEGRVARTRAVDRIVDVDWPQGVSFGMAATVAFEAMRANPLSRNWTAMCFDFERKHAVAKSEDTDTAQMNAFSPYSLPQSKMLKSMSASTFADLFSAELRHYCSHAIFIDEPIDSRIPADVKLAEEDSIAPLPRHWASTFIHIRVVTCDNPADVCSVGLHILYLPRSAWCLVSGGLGRSGSEVRDMALNALANAVGAKSMRMPKKGGGSARDEAVRSKTIGEFRGRDAVSLREALINVGFAEDLGEGNTTMTGGKGRLMRRNEAEDGPLVRSEKRQREDKSGLYEEVRDQQAPEAEVGDAIDRDPKRQRRIAREKNARARRREREAEDLFGHAFNVAGDEDLPLVENIQYDLYLPFSEKNDSVELHASIPDEIALAHSVKLRLEGTHVLAGLRKLVRGGLDLNAECRSSTGGKSTDQQSEAQGLPTWLVEVRGTRVRIGAQSEQFSDADSDLSEEAADDAEDRIAA